MTCSGYLILAADGSTVLLPVTEEMLEHWHLEDDPDGLAPAAWASARPNTSERKTNTMEFEDYTVSSHRERIKRKCYRHKNNKPAIIRLTAFLLVVLLALTGCGVQQTPSVNNSENVAAAESTNAPALASEPQAASDTASDADGFPDVETGIAQIDKYGNLDLTISPEALGEAGYEPGDIILIKIGDAEIEMPIGTHYTDVDSGAPICCLKTYSDGTGKTVLAISSGNLAETAGIAEKHAIDSEPGFEWSYLDGLDASVTVVLSMVQKQGYADEYALHRLVNSRTDNREDYPQLTDAEYANFRVIETTGMGDGTLYRSSSPVNPKMNRNHEADEALFEARIGTVINLADSESMMKQYEGFDATYYACCDIIALDMGMDYQTEDYRQKLADGLRFIASHEGPYLIHCNEGKDRAGFVAAILEALMGADADEIAADYMCTFYNFYGVVKGTDQYQIISDSFLESTLAAELGLSSVRDHNADLQPAAESYLKKIGMTVDEIASLKDRLARDCGGES